MPRMVLRAVLMLLAFLVLAPGGAQAASPALTSVSAPASVAKDGRLAVTLKLRNAGRKPTKPAKLRVLLSADRKRDGRDVTLSASVRVPAVPARRTKTVKATLTLPASVNPAATTCWPARALQGERGAAAGHREPVPAPGGGGGGPIPQPAPARPGPGTGETPTATPARRPAPPPPPRRPAPRPRARRPIPTPSTPSCRPLRRRDRVPLHRRRPDPDGRRAGRDRAARVAVLRGRVLSRDGQRRSTACGHRARPPRARPHRHPRRRRLRPRRQRRRAAHARASSATGYIAVQRQVDARGRTSRPSTTS